MCDQGERGVDWCGRFAKGFQGCGGEHRRAAPRHPGARARGLVVGGGPAAHPRQSQRHYRRRLAAHDRGQNDGEKAPTGDHIDLWNGSRLTASGLQGAIVSALRFGLGIGSGPGFSDLAKATKIVFWEVP
jgi:hypothetical protein